MKYSLADVAIQFMCKEDVERFWDKIDVLRQDDCWEWRGTKQKSSGHGVFSIRHVNCFAHRIAFKLEKGYLPDREKKRVVMHDCENPGCCNPRHLKSGTVKQNSNYPGAIAKLKSRTGVLASMHGRFGKNHPRFGKKHSSATKRKIQQFATARERRVAGRWK